jgi:hypothetical protein
MTGTVYRVWWTPGQDRLTAVCHCGARREHDDPIAAWAWLLEHPDGHEPPGESPIDGRLDLVDAER